MYNILISNGLPPQIFLKKIRKTVANKRIICNFAVSFPSGILFKGLREIRKGGAEKVKTEVPDNPQNNEYDNVI